MFRNISFMLCSFYERQQTKKLRRSRGGVSAVFWGIVSDGSPVPCICTGIGAFASCFFSFALCSVYATVPLRQHRILAGAGLITANRVVCTNIVCAIQVQVAHRHFDVVFGCFVFGLESLAFQ